MDIPPIQIRLATAEDLADIQFCARAAYAKYVERMERESAHMNADFASQIEFGQVYIALHDSSISLKLRQNR